jgi:hypothetical protein
LDLKRKEKKNQNVISREVPKFNKPTVRASVGQSLCEVLGSSTEQKRQDLGSRQFAGGGWTKKKQQTE